MSSDPSVSPQHDHKPDIRKANICPPLPQNSNGLDKLVYWLGIGLGSGLPKRAPGTWGTLGGLVVAMPMMQLGFIIFFIITLLSSLVGIWICERTSVLMNVHDDPHIVWDEWVGIWIALFPLAFVITYAPSYITIGYYWVGIGLAFVLFRVFDIAKPNPVRWADEKLSGGLGIMVDDIFAGIMALVASIMIIATILMFYPA